MLENFKSIEPLGEYDIAQEVGKLFILKKWKFLTENTKNYLTGSGCYSPDGDRINNEDSRLSDEITSLESRLGYLKQCADFRPSRNHRELIFGNVANSDEVLFACDEILYNPQWNDPFFLRLALDAFGVHRVAYLIFMLPPAEKDKSSFMIAIGTAALLFFGLLTLMFVLALPYIISEALISAVTGDKDNTVFMMYLIGLTIYLLLAFKEKLKKRKNTNLIQSYDYQFEYDEWERLNFHKTSWSTVGVGAKFYFQEMIRQGVRLPPIAIDLCAALEASMYKQNL